MWGWLKKIGRWVIGHKDQIKDVAVAVAPGKTGAVIKAGVAVKDAVDAVKK